MSPRNLPGLPLTQAEQFARADASRACADPLIDAQVIGADIGRVYGPVGPLANQPMREWQAHFRYTSGAIRIMRGERH